MLRYSADRGILNSCDYAQVAWDAIEPIWDDLPLGRFAELSVFMDCLSEGQRGLIALDWCQKEIRNGGIRQLFENSTGNLVPWAIAGFRMIGAGPYADVLARAASMIGNKYPMSGAARGKAYAKLTKEQKDQIQALEDRFFALLRDSEDDFERLRGSYVLANPQQFVGDAPER